MTPTCSASGGWAGGGCSRSIAIRRQACCCTLCPSPSAHSYLALAPADHIALHGLPACRRCSVKQRAYVLRHGLADSNEEVKQAAVQVLLRWHDVDCQSSPLQLAQRLDVHTYPAQAAAAVDALIAAKALDAAAFAQKAAAEGRAFGQLGAAAAQAGQLLSAAETLLW